MGLEPRDCQYCWCGCTETSWQKWHSVQSTLRFHFLLHYCLWLVFFEQWRDTYTCRLLEIGTCTQLLQKEGCCKGKGTVSKRQGMGFLSSGGRKGRPSVTSSWRSRCTWGGGCRSWAGQWGWPSWPASHSSQASEGARRAQFLFWKFILKNEIQN